MVNFWVVSIITFFISTFLLSRITLETNKKEIGDKMWKNFGFRTHYWKLLLLCSLGITTLILFILKWTEIVTF